MVMLEKWHSMGNDFLFSGEKLSTDVIITLCDRHFGIGADQFVLIQKQKDDEFLIKFFNPDGAEAEMCANALKCIGGFVHQKYSVKHFKAKLLRNEPEIEILDDGSTLINMGNPFKIEEVKKNEFFVDVGNPHYIYIKEYSENFLSSEEITEELKITGQKKQIEFDKGINVSFATLDNNFDILIRTFERGAGETLSCGSAATASFAVFSSIYKENKERKGFTIGSKKVLDFNAGFHLLSYNCNKQILLRGKGSKIAEINFSR